MLRLFLSLATAGLLLTFMACGPAQTGVAPEPTPPPAAAGLVQQAKQDLAKSKGVPVSSVQLVSAEPAQFNDSSLGCPEPGMSYLQVITPGWSIQLSIGADMYYYSGANGNVVACDHKPVATGGGSAGSTGSSSLQ